MLAPLQAGLGEVILGKTDVIQQLTIALVGGGHVLMENVPGVGKTTPLGGEEGWPAGNALWWLRALIDHLADGVGMRRVAGIPGNCGSAIPGTSGASRRELAAAGAGEAHPTTGRAQISEWFRTLSSKWSSVDS